MYIVLTAVCSDACCLPLWLYSKLTASWTLRGSSLVLKLTDNESDLYSVKFSSICAWSACDVLSKTEAGVLMSTMNCNIRTDPWWKLQLRRMNNSCNNKGCSKGRQAWHSCLIVLVTLHICSMVLVAHKHASPLHDSWLNAACLQWWHYLEAFTLCIWAWNVDQVACSQLGVGVPHTTSIWTPHNCGIQCNFLNLHKHDHHHDFILYLTLTQYPYDPGTLPSSANQCKSVYPCERVSEI